MWVQRVNLEPELNPRESATLKNIQGLILLATRAHVLRIPAQSPGQEAEGVERGGRNYPSQS